MSLSPASVYLRLQNATNGAPLRAFVRENETKIKSLIKRALDSVHAASEPWYKTSGNQEAVFAFMRQLNDEATQYEAESRKYQAPGGTIAVGAAYFDPFLRAYARQAFLSALRKGATPEASAETAKMDAHEAVRKHNEQRAKDHNWQRWEGGADLEIDNFVQRVRASVQPVAKSTKSRRITRGERAELVNLYHLARTALANDPEKRNSPYHWKLWASDQFHKQHPDISATAAYKALERGPLPEDDAPPAQPEAPAAPSGGRKAEDTRKSAETEITADGDKVTVTYKYKKTFWKLTGDATLTTPFVFSAAGISAYTRRAIGSLTKDEAEKVAAEWKKATGMEPPPAVQEIVANDLPVETVPEEKRAAIWSKAGAQYARVLQTAGFGEKKERSVYGSDWVRKQTIDISTKEFKVRLVTTRTYLGTERINGVRYITNGHVVLPAPDNEVTDKFAEQKGIRRFIETPTPASHEVTIERLPDPGVWQAIYKENAVSSRDQQRALLSGGGEVDPIIMYAAITSVGNGAKLYQPRPLDPVIVKGTNGTAMFMPLAK